MKKVLLCILDGWGIGSKNKYNAIESAKKKNFDYIILSPGIDIKKTLTISQKNLVL